MKPRPWIYLDQPGSLGIHYTNFPMKWTFLEEGHPWIKTGCTHYIETKDGSRKFIVHATRMVTEVIDGKACAMFGV